MTMNILHKTCECSIYQDLSKIYKILGTFGIGTKSTKMGQAYIQVEKAGQLSVTYYCTNCKKEIPFSEILGICAWCGNKILVAELFRQVNDDGKPTGDVGCKPCLEKYEVKYSSLVPLVDILSKIYINS